MKSIVYVFLLIFVQFSNLFAQERNKEITAGEISKHLYFLASDSLKGRGTGTPEIEIAAKYIADEFNHYGLKAIGDSGYFQKFQVVTGLNLESNNSFYITISGKTKEIKLSQEYIPSGFSANASVNGDIVFAGYGINAPKLNYNDYEGLDVKGKIVLVMRGSPDGDNPRGDFGEFSSLRYKTNSAKDAGAAGIIFVSVPDSTDDDILPPLEYGQMGGLSQIAVVYIKHNVINSLLNSVGLNLKELKATIDKSKKPEKVSLKNFSGKLNVEMSQVKSNAYNVVGMVEGNDPDLKNEYIVIGAHYDHLGLGSRGSMSRSKTPEIHNGADDNASGTSTILEIAQKVVAEKDKIKRSVVIAAFSGEEMGLLGSSHFVKNPPIKLENVNAMFNLDMVGRLNEEKGLTLNGIGSSPQWKEIINEVNENYKLKINFVEDASGGSDHASFYFKDIPVIFYFTGIHSDYHKPEDDADKIFYPGAEKIGKFAYDLLMNVDSRPERIKFSKVKVDPNRQNRMASRVYIGVMPDFQENPEGFKISGVTEGSPAQKAGLKSGDIIKKFGPKEVKNIEDYMYSMQQYKPGEEVELLVLRDGQELKIKIILAGRN